MSIFEKVDDDRMSVYVSVLLSHSIDYLHHVTNSGSSNASNKLLYFIQILLKNIEWALDTDP